MKEKLVDLDELWIKEYYVKRMAADWPNWDLFICSYLRFLIFCDQCHDFLEKEDRNEWNSHVNDIYNHLEKDYIADLKWISGQKRIDELDPKHINSRWKGQKGKSGTLLIGEYIDTISKKFLGIIDFNLVKDGFSERSSSPCSKGAETIIKFITTVSSTEVSSANTILAVDADKSRFRLASFLHYICQMISEETPIFNLANMMATKYDSASGSGTQTFIETVENTINNGAKSTIPFHENGIKITVKIGSTPLIVYEISPPPKLENWGGEPKHNARFFTTQAFKAAEENEIDMRIPEGTLGSKGESMGVDGFLKFDNNDKWGMAAVRAQAIRNNKVTKLKIKQFYSKGENVFIETNESIDSRNASVKSLTIKYKPTPENVNTVSYYKTLGDLGQILEYFTIYHSGVYRPHLFLTFDRICSRISSIFNRFTIFESQNDNEIIAPLYIFLPEEHTAAVAGLLDIQNKENTGYATGEKMDEVQDRILNSIDQAERIEAAGILSGKRRRENGFGKKKKVSIRNTSTMVLKAKLKSVGVPVTKVVRGKRMKLTRKQLEMRAEAFKKLQMRCQKKGISLTYVSKKKGRTFKSVKRLLSDMKRKPKPKPKTKKKSKTKWG